MVPPWRPGPSRNDRRVLPVVAMTLGRKCRHRQVAVCATFAVCVLAAVAAALAPRRRLGGSASHDPIVMPFGGVQGLDSTALFYLFFQFAASLSFLRLCGVAVRLSCMPAGAVPDQLRL